MEDLKAYLDGELSKPRRFLVGKHLGRCGACREEVEGLRQFSAEMRDLETAVPSPLLRTRIMASLPDVPPVQSTPVRWKPNPAPRYALASAFCLFVVVGAFAFNAFNKPTPIQNGAGITANLSVLNPPRYASKPQPTITQTSTPQVVVPPDDLSVKADLLVAAEEKAREQQERQAWKHWVRQTPELRQTAAVRTLPERVSLTVASTDTDTAVEALRQKVAALGGKLYLVSHSDTAQTVSGVFSNAPAESLYAAKIPTTQVRPFVEALDTAGTISTLPKRYRATGAKPSVFVSADSATLKSADPKIKTDSASKVKTPAANKGESIFVLVALRQGE